MAERKKGYTITLDKTNNILKLRLWGFWDNTIAQQFEKEAKEKIVEMSRHAPQGWSTLVDLSQFPPQNQEVQEMAKGIMLYEVTNGMKKAATLVDQALTKTQVQRLAKQQGLDPGSFFQTEAEAVRWLIRSA